MAEQTTSLVRYAWLSIAAAILTIALKGGAYVLTGSVGLLSDAVESLVNLLAAIMALGMLILASRPPDEEHAFGHHKAEYFASGFEGALILVAAVGIGWTAVGRLLDPQPLEELGIGLGISVIASIVNLGVARVLFRAGRQHGSIALEADAHHLITDVWTSGGVIIGVVVAELTGWNALDALVALAVAFNVVRLGVELLHRSALGLLDTAIPEADRAAVHRVLARYQTQGIEYHALRTRQAAARRFVSVHVLVPGAWSVQQGHEVLEQIEADIRAELPNSTVFTHLEPLEDPVSWADAPLER